MIAAGEEVERYHMQSERKTPRAEYVSYQMAQALPIAILFGIAGLGLKLGHNTYLELLARRGVSCLL